MMAPVTVVVTLLALTAGAAALFAAHLVRRHRFAAALPLAVASGAIALWAGAYALEIVAQTRAAMVLWANVQFVGIAIVPVATLETTRRLIGGRPVSRLGAILLLLVPIVTVALAFTSELHPLFRGNPSVISTALGPMLNADYRWFHSFVFVPFQYTLYLASIVLLIEARSSAHPRFAGGYRLLVGAMAVPLAGGLLYLLGIGPFAIVNPTPMVLMLTVALFGSVLKRDVLLDLTPIARTTVFETLREGVIVLDRGGRIVDANCAAARLLPEIAPGAISVGAQFREVVAQHVPLVLLADGIQETEAAFTIERPSGAVHMLATPAPITDAAGELRGRVITLTDITRATELVRTSAPNRREATIYSEVRLNRPDFFAVLAAEVERAVAYIRPITLVLLSCDAGQPELQRDALAAAIARACGPTVWLSWLSPAELAVLLPERGAGEAEDQIVPVLPVDVSIAAIHAEMGRQSLTMEEFLLHTRRKAVR